MNHATIKLIIWDLDDTLWRGTLADGEPTELFEGRAEMIRAFNQRGVVSAICSKNDFATAKARLVELGLWDEFVFPHIAFEPKPQAIAGIIEDMQLRAANVLFVDDNPVNLNEVRFCLPEVTVLDITHPDSEAFLSDLLARQKGTRSRMPEYRMLECKQRDRSAAPALSNEDFLHSCEIKACAPSMSANLDFVDRIVELINRSNQLNYTSSRTTRDELERDIVNIVAYYCWSVFAWDKYGDYGLVGFVMLDRAKLNFKHFTFSCRAMHMGLEEYALGKIREKYPRFFTTLDLSMLEGRFDRTSPAWIADQSYGDPIVRTMVISHHVPDLEAADLRIMCDCQSGGLAHYSRWRARIDFDNVPRVFRLPMFLDGSAARERYPNHLIYGPGADYADLRWPGMADQLDANLYLLAVQRMCIFLVENGIKALIILSPEDHPDSHYGRLKGLTRARTREFNALWRRAAQVCDAITLLDVSDVCGPEEMIDANHHHPSSLRKMSRRIDDWYEQVSSSLPAIDPGADLANAAPQMAG
jgi:FkbH-like protein